MRFELKRSVHGGTGRRHDGSRLALLKSPASVLRVVVLTVVCGTVSRASDFGPRSGTVRTLRHAPASTTSTVVQESADVSRLREAATRGDSEAQFKLALLYMAGDSVVQDFGKAVDWWRHAAEQGHAAAQFNLGVAYGNGIGVGQDYAQAVQWYRKAAEQRHAGAQLNLGLSYMRGNGVPRDSAEAVAWYRKAADQGSAGAQFNLGFMYYRGAGVAQDFAQASQWFAKAAEQGIADAQSNLGSMYASGRGVPQDYVEAHKWLSIAAAGETGQEQQQYAEARDAVAAVMTRSQIAEAQKRAQEWQDSFQRRKN